MEVMEKSSLEVEAGVGRKLCFGTTEFKSSYDEREIKGNGKRRMHSDRGQEERSKEQG